MKIKCIMSTCLILCLLIFSTGCVKGKDITNELSKNISEGGENSSGFEYKMAQIYEARNTNDKYKNWISFAIEVTSRGYEIYDLTVDNMNDSNEDEVSIFKGNVCLDDKYHSQNSLLSGTEYDNELYTILIKTNKDISTSDIIVKGTTHYNSIGSGISEEMEFKVNSDISEITTIQEMIHNATLFEMGGTYYVFDTEGFGGGYKKDIRYKTFCIHRLRPEDTLLDTKSGDVSAVYSDTCREYVIPNECKLYYNSELDTDGTINLELGLIKNELSDSDYENYAIDKMRLKYTDEKGSMILYIP